MLSRLLRKFIKPYYPWDFPPIKTPVPPPPLPPVS